MSWDLVSSFLIAMIAIVNPLGKIPLWVEASRGQSAAARRRLAVMVVATATAVLWLALLAGQSFLDLFGVDLASFRVGGGIVILLVGISMVRSSAVSIGEADEQAVDDDPLLEAKLRFRRVVVPMAMPLIAGPGSISTAIVYSARASGALDLLALSGMLLLVMTVVLLMLLAGRRVRRLFGATALDIQTRFFGLILAGIAVQLIVEGLGEIFPAWVTPQSVLRDADP